jgi:hypothetical protein
VVPAEATLSAAVSETVHRRQVTGSNPADVACPGPAGRDVALVVAADTLPRFKPRTVQIELELSGCALPDAQGHRQGVDQFGIFTKVVQLERSIPCIVASRSPSRPSSASGWS